MIETNFKGEVEIDDAEFDDLCQNLADAFGIEYTTSDSQYVETHKKIQKIKVGDLIKLVTGKISLGHSNDCTTQQTFYKLRDFFVRETGVPRALLQVNSNIEILLPRRDRKALVAQIEEKLGVKVGILRLKSWIQWTKALLFIAAFVVCGINFLVGLGLFLIFWGLTYLKGNELTVRNLGEMSKAIASQNYRTLRNIKGTFNLKEAERVAFEMIVQALDFYKKGIDYNTKIKWRTM